MCLQPPLLWVLVPGAWRSASDWDAVIGHLPGVEARAVELPSHGATTTGLGDMYASRA